MSQPHHRTPSKTRTKRSINSGLERARGAGRRLSHAARAAQEGELTKEQFLFVVAIDEFKKANGVTYPAWSDVVEVIRLLGYRKVRPSELNLPRAEDWREQPSAPADVRPENWRNRFDDDTDTLSFDEAAAGERDQNRLRDAA